MIKNIMFLLVGTLLMGTAYAIPLTCPSSVSADPQKCPAGWQCSYQVPPSQQLIAFGAAWIPTDGGFGSFVSCSYPTMVGGVGGGVSIKLMGNFVRLGNNWDQNGSCSSTNPGDCAFIPATSKK
jgi:hypothetical protein